MNPAQQEKEPGNSQSSLSLQFSTSPTPSSNKCSSSTSVSIWSTFLLLLALAHLSSAIIITSVQAGDKKFKTISFDSKWIKPITFQQKALLPLAFRLSRTLRLPKFNVNLKIPIRLPMDDAAKGPSYGGGNKGYGGMGGGDDGYGEDSEVGGGEEVAYELAPGSNPAGGGPYQPGPMGMGGNLNYADSVPLPNMAPNMVPLEGNTLPSDGIQTRFSAPNRPLALVPNPNLLMQQSALPMQLPQQAQLQLQQPQPLQMPPQQHNQPNSIQNVIQNAESNSMVQNDMMIDQAPGSKDPMMTSSSNQQQQPFILVPVTQETQEFVNQMQQNSGQGNVPQSLIYRVVPPEQQQQMNQQQQQMNQQQQQMNQQQQQESVANHQPPQGNYYQTQPQQSQQSTQYVNPPPNQAMYSYSSDQSESEWRPVAGPPARANGGFQPGDSPVELNESDDYEDMDPPSPGGQQNSASNNQNGDDNDQDEDQEDHATGESNQSGGQQIVNMNQNNQNYNLAPVAMSSNVQMNKYGGGGYRQPTPLVEGGAIQIQASGPHNEPKKTYEDYERDRWAQVVKMTPNAAPPVLNPEQLNRYYQSIGMFTSGLPGVPTKPKIKDKLKMGLQNMTHKLKNMMG